MTEPADEGSGTVLGVGLAGAAITVLLVISVGVAAVAGHARARTAADLGALAAAAVAVGELRAPGTGDPCAVAAAVVQANNAAVTSCEVLPGAQVRVVVGTPVALGTATSANSIQLRVLTGFALAGPAP